MVALSAALLQTNVAFAELKIGVYDNRQVLDNLPIVAKEFQKLNAEFEPKKKEISDKQAELNALREDIEKNAPVLSAEQMQVKQLAFQSKRGELQLLAEDSERVFNVRRNDIVRKIQGMVVEEVVKIAKEEQYDLILQSGVLYAGAKVDITKKVLDRLSAK